MMIRNCVRKIRKNHFKKLAKIIKKQKIRFGILILFGFREICCYKAKSRNAINVLRGKSFEEEKLNILGGKFQDTKFFQFCG